MRENIDVRPASKIQYGAMRQEVETGLGYGGAVLARQIDVKLGFELVQIEHIGGGIGALCLGEILGAPIGGLLLLGEFYADEFAGSILQSVPIRGGAGELGGDFRAIDGRGEDTEAMHHDGDVKPAEMEELEHFRVGQ